MWTSFQLKAQQSYDTCSTALALCPQKLFNITNVNASQTTYSNGEDDFNFCFTPQKTIWCKFETNQSGGSAQINLANLIFQTPTVGGMLGLVVIEAGFPCDGSTYTKDTCISNINTAGTILIDSLKPLTDYYLCLSGVSVGGVVSQFSLDLSMSGKSIDRPASYLYIVPSKQKICYGEQVQISAYPQNCPVSSQFRWYKNGNLFAVSDSSFIYTASIHMGDVITVENSCYQYCSDTIQASTPPFVVDSFGISISHDTTLIAQQPLNLVCYTPVDSILWIPSHLVQYPDSIFTMAYPDETTSFTAQAYINGCKVTQSMTVTMLNQLKVYNTFSPNEDGINERWIIPGIEMYPNAEVSIFNRWGRRVFFGMGYKASNAWDGNIDGKTAEVGTYFYVIDLKSAKESKLIKGSLNLIR